MEEKFVESRPTNPKNSDKYRDKDGITHVFNNGRWIIIKPKKKTFS